MKRVNVTDSDVKKLIQDYQNGTNIYDICNKYHLGKIRVKNILSNNNIVLRKRGKQPIDRTDFKINDYKYRKYTNDDEYHYIVIDKNNDSFISNDIYNNAGVLTKYIETQYNITIPSLYERRNYYLKYGDYWWEQWLSYKTVRNASKIRCPYCGWETIDVDNKSGAFEMHLYTVHNIDKYSFVENFPEYHRYFSQIKNPVSLRQFETDMNKFVMCKICGKKLSRIGTKHLITHGISKEEYINLYGDDKLVSNDFYNKSVKHIMYYNNKLEHSFHSYDENDIINFIKNIGFECKSNRSVLNGKEIDIYINDLNIGFEYDGILWHTENFGKKDKFYHVNKTDDCLRKGISLYHIFEDEYKLKKDVVQHKIMNILNVDNCLVKIKGNKCDYSIVDNDDAIEFIENYSLLYPRNINEKYIGAFYNNELVVLYSLYDNVLMHYGDNYHYNCSDIHQRLFNFVLSLYHSNDLTAYDDRRWVIKTDMSIYHKIGMKFVSVCEPSCTYFNSKISRFRHYDIQYIRDNLKQKDGSHLTDEYLISSGYDRIWNCGYFKYKLSRNI